MDYGTPKTIENIQSTKRSIGPCEGTCDQYQGISRYTNEGAGLDTLLKRFDNEKQGLSNSYNSIRGTIEKNWKGDKKVSQCSS